VGSWKRNLHEQGQVTCWLVQPYHSCGPLPCGLSVSCSNYLLSFFRKFYFIFIPIKLLYLLHKVKLTVATKIEFTLANYKHILYSLPIRLTFALLLYFGLASLVSNIFCNFYFYLGLSIFDK
jgi:hypothetical protein